MNGSFQYINLDYLELMTEGDKDMQKTMLEMLLDEFKTEIPKMKNLMSNQNWTELKDVSHRFKSTLAFVGNELATDANKEVEQITRNGNGFEKLPDLVSLLESMQSKIHGELKLAYELLR